MAGARPGPALPADVRRAAGRSPRGRAAPLCWRPWARRGLGAAAGRERSAEPGPAPTAGPAPPRCPAGREPRGPARGHSPVLGPAWAPGPRCQRLPAVRHTVGSCTTRRDPAPHVGRSPAAPSAEKRDPPAPVLLPAAPAPQQRALVFWCSMEGCFDSTQQRRLFHSGVLTSVPFLFQQNYCHGNSSAGAVWWEQPLSRQF